MDWARLRRYSGNNLIAKGEVDMPFIQVNILKGRSPEKKERLIREMTDLVSEVLDAPVQSVRVMINELEPEHWGIAGESVKKRNEVSK
ncbi:2-hydroxymuconate tautomerase [Neobacillus vireti]|uniref:2-hydroxymuconate tautomerase n=1 Tax=Neobacillus vireti TaxID=220686 RepID=UPI003B588588